MSPFDLRRTEALSGNGSRRLVEEYAEQLRNGDKPPPVLLAEEGGHYYIIDGHHRVAAARRVNVDVPVRMATEAELLDTYPGGMDEVARLWAEVGPDRLVNPHKRRGGYK